MALPTQEDLQTAVAVAVHAPSLHNTQPWRWAVRHAGLDLYADRSRMLTVADPDGRALHLSCGAALQHATLALRSEGWESDVVMLPADDDPNFLAAIRVTDQVKPQSSEIELVYAVLWRTSERRTFDDRPLPTDVSEQLIRATESEGAHLHLIGGGPLADQVAVVVAHADAEQRADPAYRAELAAWIRTDPLAPDGIPLRQIPRLSGHLPRTSTPTRDLEVAGAGLLDVDVEASEHPTLAVVSSDTDDPYGWLTAGRGMSRLLLTATVEGVSASPLSQALEVPVARRALRAALGTVGYPQAMLRLGYLPPELPPLTLTPRRAVVDVLVHEEDPVPEEDS